MSEMGVIFDIKQFAIFDGPGIRTTVFLKGCPLRCMWCHNPEGLSYQLQIMVSSNGCTECGRCRQVCKSPQDCTLCGICIRVCPNHLRKVCGDIISAKELAERLLMDQEYLKAQGGGITFSGGEPTGQPYFLLELMERLASVHLAIETSGYCDADSFHKIIERLDYIIMDLKIVDDRKHLEYTGVSNRLILHNLDQVKKSGKPFVIRIPIIPGVNDSDDNYEKTAQLLEGASNLCQVELLPYHMTAGAKYSMVGLDYKPGFDVEAEPHINKSIFHKYGIACIQM